MIADKLNNKQYLRLVTSTKTSPLDLSQRLAYSALLSKADGLSQGAVSLLTGLDAKGTVAAALKVLSRHGLAVQDVNHWLPLEPNEGRKDWFSIAIKDEHWRNRLAYTKLYRRAEECPLTLRQVVVYSTLISLAKGSKDRKDLPERHRGRVCDGLTFEYISLISSVGVKTVRSTIDKLAEMKLAKSFASTLRSRFALVLLIPKDEAMPWFLDKEAESYPGLFEFVDDEAQLVEEDADHYERADTVGRRPESMNQLTEAVQAPGLPPKVSIPEWKRTSKQPIQGVEAKTLPTVSGMKPETSDPLERHRLHVLGVRLGKEQEIKQILLGFGYSEPSAAKLSGSFDRSGLPSFDAYRKMIHDAEATFRRNRSEGRYPNVRTSELLLVKWLDHHRQEAVEKLDRFLEAHDQKAWQQRLSDIGRAALERAWEKYADPLTAPFDARLFAERVADGERLWIGWERDYGEDACRRALINLNRVRIEEMLVEPGRIEPEEFILRLRTIAPPRTILRKPSEDEMYEAWQAEMRGA